LATWIADELRANAEFRKDLPLFASAGDRRAHEAVLRQAIVDFWKPGIVDIFLSDQQRRFTARSHLSLPQAVVDAGPLSEDTWIAFVGMLPPIFQRNEQHGLLHVSALGQDWTFKLAAAPLIGTLVSTNRPLQVSELLASSNLPPQAAQALLKRLIVDGFAYIVTSNDKHD